MMDHYCLLSESKKRREKNGRSQCPFFSGCLLTAAKTSHNRNTPLAERLYLIFYKRYQCFIIFSDHSWEANDDSVIIYVCEFGGTGYRKALGNFAFPDCPCQRRARTRLKMDISCSVRFRSSVSVCGLRGETVLPDASTPSPAIRPRQRHLR